MTKVLGGYREILLEAGFREDRINVSLIIRQCTSIGDAIIEEQEKLRCWPVLRRVSAQRQSKQASSKERLRPASSSMPSMRLLALIPQAFIAL